MFFFLDATNHSSATTAKKPRFIRENQEKNDCKVNCAQNIHLVDLYCTQIRGKKVENVLTKVPLKLHEYIQLLCYITTEHKKKTEKEREREDRNKAGKQQKTGRQTDKHP